MRYGASNIITQYVSEPTWGHWFGDPRVGTAFMKKQSDKSAHETNHAMAHRTSSPNKCPNSYGATGLVTHVLGQHS